MPWKDHYWEGGAITSASRTGFSNACYNWFSDSIKSTKLIVEAIRKMSFFHNQENGSEGKKCRKPKTDLGEDIEDDVSPHSEEKLPRGPCLVRVDERVKLEVHVVHIFKL